MDEVAANEPDSPLLAAKTKDKKEKKLLQTMKVNCHATVIL